MCICIYIYIFWMSSRLAMSCLFLSFFTSSGYLAIFNRTLPLTNINVHFKLCTYIHIQNSSITLCKPITTNFAHSQKHDQEWFILDHTRQDKTRQDKIRRRFGQPDMTDKTRRMSSGFDIYCRLSWRKYQIYCLITWCKSSLVIGWLLCSGLYMYTNRYILYIYICSHNFPQMVRSLSRVLLCNPLIWGVGVSFLTHKIDIHV